ncbi:MAG TPA: hypothetical protein VIL32_15650 [Steroidobacteraceae bacterium]
MKLRIKGDSLRLRLTQGEVAALAEHGVVEDQVRFGPGVALAYRVTCDANIERMIAAYGPGGIDVRVPEPLARNWCATEEVTLSDSQEAGDISLRIVVEKDFACLSPREGEDESDNFPHPLAGVKTC